jgi:diacylglycerol kinase (ATP)
MTRRRILLLVNPAAGGKLGSGPDLADDAARLEPEALASALRERGLVVDLRILAEADDVRALSAAAVASGQDVVAAGGDGTVGLAASGLVGSEATLGILALGSFNNVAHGYGVPRRLDAALEVIAHGEASRVDVGVARHGSHGTDGVFAEDATDAEAGEEAFFFEAAGVGLDAAGFGAAQVTERHGWLRGAGALVRALRQRRRAMRLLLDGRSVRTHAPAVTICNGPYLGMGFALAADADPTDGLLDVVVFGGMSRWEVLRHFARVARGSRHREPRLRIVRAAEVQVHAAHGVLAAHADGRSIGVTPATFSVRPGALRLFR